MVFIKGAWIDLNPWDERYLDYYCCPNYQLMVTVPYANDDKTTYDYHSMYYSCGLNGQKICDKTPVYARNGDDIVTPRWCPLKDK